MRSGFRIVDTKFVLNYLIKILAPRLVRSELR